MRLTPSEDTVIKVEGWVVSGAIAVLGAAAIGIKLFDASCALWKRGKQ